MIPEILASIGNSIRNVAVASANVVLDKLDLPQIEFTPTAPSGAPAAAAASGVKGPGQPSPYSHLYATNPAFVSWDMTRPEQLAYSEVGLDVNGYVTELYGSRQAADAASGQARSYAESVGLDYSSFIQDNLSPSGVAVVDSKLPDGTWRLPGSQAFATPRGESGAVIGIESSGASVSRLKLFNPSYENEAAARHEISHVLFSPPGGDDSFSSYLYHVAGPIPTAPEGTALGETYASGVPSFGGLLYGLSDPSGSELIPIASMLQRYAVGTRGPAGRAATPEEAGRVLDEVIGLEDKSVLEPGLRNAIKGFSVPLYGPAFRERLRYTVPLILGENDGGGFPSV